ncbi:MAG: hypothetical protein ACYDB7_04580 [Mycobacteriales bacterium]
MCRSAMARDAGYDPELLAGTLGPRTSPALPARMELADRVLAADGLTRRRSS